MPVLSYSPSHTDVSVLERLTTGAERHRLIETLVEAVRSEVGRDALQHQLLIGPRGSGKTHALEVVAHRLRTDPELQSRVLPIVLAEEEVASHPADLMQKALAKLTEILEVQRDLTGRDAALRENRLTLAVLRSERDDERALDMAVGALEAAASTLNRLLVLVVENLDKLLYAGPGLSRRTVVEGQWDLRRSLLQARGLLVLGAAPSLFGEVTHPNAPFYDFFRLHCLSELSPEEMLSLIKSRLDLELENEALDPTRKNRLQALADHFEERTPKLRGLLVLTGGLPRFAHLIFDLLAETDVSSVAATISRFLDEQTPYFQSRLDPRLIPEAELEILDALASAPGPLTPKEIAGELRGKAPNAVATFLKRLRERGLVRPSGASRKETRYDLTEPLFRVWRRFRLGRTEREQVVVLAEFVAAMFDRKELEAEWQCLAGIEAGLRRSVVESALGLGVWSVKELEALPGKQLSPGLEYLSRLAQAADQEYKTGSLLKAYELYEEAIAAARQRAPEWVLLYLLIRSAPIALISGAPQTAMQISLEAEKIATDCRSDLGLATAILSRGYALLKLGANQKALQGFRKAEGLYKRNRDELGRASAIFGRGRVFLQLGDNQKAWLAFQDAEELFRGVGSDLGLGGCHLGYGQLAWFQEDWAKWLDHLLKGFQLARKVGDRIPAEMTASEIWNGLSRLAPKLEPDNFRHLLRAVAPLVRATATDESVWDGLIRFGFNLLTEPGPGFLLDVLPILEGGLQDSQTTIFLPIRLAAEIQTGRRSKELPENAEEVRRAVKEVLRLIERDRLETKEEDINER
jgi:tetratricopeptide (TPR) repeat protein/DNA-binding MarR family transcriptional regulator